MNRDNAISRGDYLRPWEFIVETKFVEGFPISHALFDLPSDTARATLVDRWNEEKPDLQLQLCVYLWRTTRVSSIDTEYEAAHKLLSQPSFYLLVIIQPRRRIRKVEEANTIYVDSLIERKKFFENESSPSDRWDLNVNGIAFRVESSSIRVDSV